MLGFGHHETKNFLENFLHRAILPGALRVDLRSLKSVPDSFLTTFTSARRGGRTAFTSHWLVP